MGGDGSVSLLVQVLSRSRFRIGVPCRAAESHAQAQVLLRVLGVSDETDDAVKRWIEGRGQPAPPALPLPDWPVPVLLVLGRARPFWPGWKLQRAARNQRK